MKKCCICDKEFEGYGNNAEPLVKNGVCCDRCQRVVEHARFQILAFSKRSPQTNKEILALARANSR